MSQIQEFLSATTKLYFGFEHREEGFSFIRTHVLLTQAFYSLLFISIWYYLITSNNYNILNIIGSGILFSLSTFLAVGLIHLVMRILGGIGEFREMYKFGLCIWFFPTLINIVVYLLSLIFQNKTLSFIFGIFLALLAVYTFIVSMLIYGKIQKLSVEYSFLGLLIPFLISSLFIYIIRLTI
ncbi:MAG: hypothetical protein HRU03_03005 [Nanoarchaeales archaeon]|nr:hypothetical protein [Nanoarchaeales archaeon]